MTEKGGQRDLAPPGGELWLSVYAGGERGDLHLSGQRQLDSWGVWELPVVHGGAQESYRVNGASESHILGVDHSSRLHRS